MEGIITISVLITLKEKSLKHYSEQSAMALKSIVLEITQFKKSIKEYVRLTIQVMMEVLWKLHSPVVLLGHYVWEFCNLKGWIIVRLCISKSI